MDKILKKYKNALFEAVNKSGLEKGLFTYEELKDYSGRKIFKIIVKNTPFYFEMTNHIDSFDTFFCSYVLFNAKYTSTGPSAWVDINAIVDSFNKWIHNNVKVYFDELAEIDLWEQLKSSDNILDVNKIDFEDREYFNKDEQKQIELAVNDLKLLISKNFALLGDEVKAVNDRLDYLCDASKRLNKFDWKSLLLNTAINIVVALSLDTEKGRQLFQFFKQVFSIVTTYMIGN